MPGGPVVCGHAALGGRCIFGCDVCVCVSGCALVLRAVSLVGGTAAAGSDGVRSGD